MPSEPREQSQHNWFDSVSHRSVAPVLLQVQRTVFGEEDVMWRTVYPATIFGESVWPSGTW